MAIAFALKGHFFAYIRLEGTKKIELNL